MRPYSPRISHVSLQYRQQLSATQGFAAQLCLGLCALWLMMLLHPASPSTAHSSVRSLYPSTEVALVAGSHQECPEPSPSAKPIDIRASKRRTPLAGSTPDVSSPALPVSAGFLANTRKQTASHMRARPCPQCGHNLLEPSHRLHPAQAPPRA